MEKYIDDDTGGSLYWNMLEMACKWKILNMAQDGLKYHSVP